jgi:hypothetical protein
MIGGAILPLLLHQDPRHFYQGTGTNRPRFIKRSLAHSSARETTGGSSRTTRALVAI